MDMELLALLARTGSCPSLEAIEYCYPVSQAAPAAPAVIKATAHFHHRTKAKVIVSMADAGIGMNPNLPLQPANGYEGGEVWKERLSSLGVPSSYIQPMHGARVDGGYEAKDFNTLTEMQALVRHLCERGITEVVLVAPDFHLPRAIVSFVTALEELHGVRIWAWGRSVPTCSWEEEVIHSQGVLKGTVKSVFQAEISKIHGEKRYTNLASLACVTKYLDDRDTLFN